MENKKDYLIAFDHEVDYFSYVSSDSFVKPNVSLCRDTENVFYHCKDEEENVDYSTQYFTIKNTGNDVLTITAPTSISHRKLTETEWTESDVTLNPNESVCFKGVIEQSKNVGTFIMEGDTTCDVEGNVMSLIYGDDFEGKTDLSGTNSKFSDLIRDCAQLINANNLILPAITPGIHCYGRMFRGCTSLVTAPELPATTLVDDCYTMMFYGCTSLVKAPELPATTLAAYCYNFMFYGCTSLVESPKLPATTLAESCYYRMFDGCSNLNKVTMLATNVKVVDCFTDWLNGVASTGTFIKILGVKLPENTIPSGWDIINIESQV